MKTFKQWIVEYAGTAYLVGDLAKDIRGDKSFPDSNDRDVIRNYLEYKALKLNNDVVVEIFDACWTLYKMLYIKD